MFHEDILYRQYIKTSFLISNMHCQELYLGNFKSNLDFFAPSDSRFSNSCISAKYCPITKHTSMESLFIQLSDEVYISNSKNWHLRLILLSGSHCIIHIYYLEKTWKHKNHIVFTFHQLSIMLVIQLSYSDSGMPVKRYYYFSYESVLDFLRESFLWLWEWMKHARVRVFSALWCSHRLIRIIHIQNNETIFSLLIKSRFTHIGPRKLLL